MHTLARLFAIAVISLAGCGAPMPAERNSLSYRLAKVGLELLSEDQAQLPPAERGRYVPCRVIPGFPRPPLEEHPAGYLIVGVDGQPAPSAQAILTALEAWWPGRQISLKVRRNPYLLAEAEWWEADVRLR